MKKLLYTSLLSIGFLATSFVSEPKKASGYEVGDVATDFKLKNIDNKMVSLSDYKDAKGFIVVFTCNLLDCIIITLFISTHNLSPFIFL